MIIITINLSNIFNSNYINNYQNRCIKYQREMDTNKGIIRNVGYLKSLVEDKRVRKRGEKND